MKRQMVFRRWIESMFLNSQFGLEEELLLSLSILEILKGSLSHMLLTIDFLSVVGTWMKSGQASPNNVIFTKLELGY